MRTLLLVAAMLSACVDRAEECSSASTGSAEVDCMTSAGSAGVCVTPFDIEMNGPGPSCFARAASNTDPTGDPYVCPDGSIVVGRTIAGSGVFVCEPGTPPPFPP